jgi:hypothetical protein
MQNSLLEAMERLFDARLPAAGGGDWQHHHQADHNAKASDENSGARQEFCDHFNGGRGGGRHAGHQNHRGSDHGRGFPMYTLMMRMKSMTITMRNLMTMSILLQTMDNTGSTMNIVMVLINIGNIIGVVTIGMILRILHETS